MREPENNATCWIPNDNANKKWFPFFQCTFIPNPILENRHFITDIMEYYTISYFGIIRNIAVCNISLFEHFGYPPEP